MPRKYFKTSIDELETLFKENLRRRQVLGEIREELTYRTNRRAVQLRKEVEAVIAGEVKVPPAPPGPERPEDQMDLLSRQRNRSKA